MLQRHGDGLVLREWSDAALAAMSELFDEPSIDDWTHLVSPSISPLLGAFSTALVSLLPAAKASS